MNKVLLLGANGFIATNLSQILNKNLSFEVVSISSKDCDLRNFPDTKRLIVKVNPDFIINCAYIVGGANPKFSKKYLFDNEKITINILNSARGLKNLKKILFFGSSLEYADAKEPIPEDYSIRPKTIYSGVKAANSVLALTLAREYSLPLILIRPFTVYGPHETKSVIYYLVKSIQENKQFSITAGEQIKDYIFIDDFCGILIQILENYEKFDNLETFNIGSGIPVKLQEVFSIILTSTNKKSINYKIKPYNINDNFYMVADITKIKKIINLKIQTPLKKGLQKTIEWIINDEK